MRQGQQNRRGRGRNNNNGNNNNNNNNRKGQNPLTRSFESNGPDMKIRGTPAHIAEKYMSLGRDAMASGDRVLAENYLQHAEHYNRIIMTYREQQVGQGSEAVGQNRQRQHSQHDQIDSEDGSGSDGDDYSGNDSQITPPGSEPQPALADLDGGNGPSEPRAARPRNDQRSEHRPENRQDGRQQGRRSRPSGGGDRPQRDRAPASNGNGSVAGGSGNEAAESNPRQRGNDHTRFGESSDQPDFLRRPIRRPRRQAGDDGDDAAPKAAKAARDPAPADDTQD